jgi:hypothetical protein
MISALALRSRHLGGKVGRTFFNRRAAENPEIAQRVSKKSRRHLVSAYRAFVSWWLTFSGM